MAADSREPSAPSSDSQTATAAAAAGEAQKPLPPGMVLGPDGKPCRTCSSGSAFAAWTRQAKTLTTTATTPTSTNSVIPYPTTPPNCPPDVEVLGRSTWTLLHSIAAQYPTHASPAQQADVTSFLYLLSRLYPCWSCAADFQAYVGEKRVRAATRDELGNWLCEAHNAVNAKLGKPRFDCRRWEERWREGGEGC